MRATGTSWASSRRRTRRSRGTSPARTAAGRILSWRRPVSAPSAWRPAGAGALGSEGESVRLTGAVRAWATARQRRSATAGAQPRAPASGVRPTPPAGGRWPPAWRLHPDRMTPSSPAARTVPAMGAPAQAGSECSRSTTNRSSSTSPATSWRRHPASAGWAGRNPGEEALDAVTKLEPELVLMDVRMPGMDGIEAARRICENIPRSWWCSSPSRRAPPSRPRSRPRRRRAGPQTGVQPGDAPRGCGGPTGSRAPRKGRPGSSRRPRCRIRVQSESRACRRPPRSGRACS